MVRRGTFNPVARLQVRNGATIYRWQVTRSRHCMCIFKHSSFLENYLRKVPPEDTTGSDDRKLPPEDTAGSYHRKWWPEVTTGRYHRTIPQGAMTGSYHRKVPPEDTTGSDDRKLPPEGATGNYHRKWWPEIITGRYHRKIPPEVMTGSYLRTVPPEVITRSDDWKLPPEDTTGRYHQKWWPEVTTGRYHRKIPQEAMTGSYLRTFPSIVSSRCNSENILQEVPELSPELLLEFTTGSYSYFSRSHRQKFSWKRFMEVVFLKTSRIRYFWILMCLYCCYSTSTIFVPRDDFFSIFSCFGLCHKITKMMVIYIQFTPISTGN